MNSIEEWIETHDEQLRDIAEDTEMAAPLVHLAAILMLAGVSDEEIYEQLSQHALSMDGQGSPLAGAPEALQRVRQLAAS